MHLPSWSCWVPTQGAEAQKGLLILYLYAHGLSLQPGQVLPRLGNMPALSRPDGYIVRPCIAPTGLSWLRCLHQHLQQQARAPVQRAR